MTPAPWARQRLEGARGRIRRAAAAAWARPATADRHPATHPSAADGIPPRPATHPHPAAASKWHPGVRTRTRDTGTAALEYLGMLPFLLLVALAAIQLGIAAYCGEQAGTAARTAARTAAQHGAPADPVQAGRDAVSGWVDPDISVSTAGGTGSADRGAVTATATVHIPSVLPGLHLLDPVTRSATMPEEDSTP